MNNSAVGFPLVPLQKQIETAPHLQRQVTDAQVFNLLQRISCMRRQYYARISKQEKDNTTLQLTNSRPNKDSFSCETTSNRDQIIATVLRADKTCS